MTIDQPLTLLAAAAAAALAGGLGPLLHHRVLAWTDALAAGIMLGTGFVLISVALQRVPAEALTGATLGILAAFGTHVLLGIGARPVSATLASAVHSAPEGVAMGSAVALAPAFGVFVILTFALHNASEGSNVIRKLGRAGIEQRRACLLAIGARLAQVFFAVFTFVLVSRFPGMLTFSLGLAFGAMVYLCLAELLPASYAAAGRTSIAVVASVAAGIVALMGQRIH